MATSLDSPSPAHLNKVLKGSMASPPHPLASSSSPLLFSPASDKRFWSTLRRRMDTLLENRLLPAASGQDLDTNSSVGRCDRAKRMKEDSLLLLRGFDSVSHTLSQLSDNLENALQGARSLAEPPTLSEILQSKIHNSEATQGRDLENRSSGEEEGKKVLKRKFDPSEDDASGDGAHDSLKETEEIPKDKKLKKAKNIAISMAKKAASLARELKSLRSDFSFMQEKCLLLEEENRRLRDGFSKGIRPEEDDLMRLQMEVLLAEKSRLANENANLVRENQCLRQLVEYHQFTSQDLSASYEEVLRGMCLDFSSPISPVVEDEDNEGDEQVEQTPKTGIMGLATSLDERFHQEQ